MEKIEHIGIAVQDLQASIRLFTSILGKEPYKTENVDSEKVTTVFFQVGETKIELLAATSPDSVIQKFIDKKGEGIHHIAFAVDNIEEKMEYCKENGIELIQQQPKDGADNKKICFLHPKSTNGVLIELCMEKP
jgi:methylmalonyl-CoA/ethylmalonyl-CoA epimerase